MANTHELQQLTRWCTARQLLWQPSQTEQGTPAILLRPHVGRQAWHEMLLVENDDGVALIDETGDILADASQIPALLDALDSGLITGPAKLQRRMHYPIWSETIANNVGVGIT